MSADFLPSAFYNMRKKRTEGGTQKRDKKTVGMEVVCSKILGISQIKERQKGPSKTCRDFKVLHFQDELITATVLSPYIVTITFQEVREITENHFFFRDCCRLLLCTVAEQQEQAFLDQQVHSS